MAWSRGSTPEPGLVFGNPFGCFWQPTHQRGQPLTTAPKHPVEEFWVLIFRERIPQLLSGADHLLDGVTLVPSHTRTGEPLSQENLSWALGEPAPNAAVGLCKPAAPQSNSLHSRS
jgi:hypothetical protein